MKQAATATAIIVPIALAAMVALHSFAPPPPDPTCEVVEGPAELEAEDAEQMAPVGPIRVATQYRVNCPQVDGGTVADLLVPMDGGTAGVRVKTDTLYVAPVSGTTQLRVGFGTSLTPSKGFEIGLTGSSARDGVGVTVDATESSNPTCVSEGNAQQVDVITGRQ